MDKTKKEHVALWITFLGAVLLTAILMFLWSRRTEEYDIVFFGDSRTEGLKLESTVPELTEAATGLRALNAGFGGTALSLLSDDIYEYPEDMLSMVSLSEGLETGFKPVGAWTRGRSIYFKDRSYYNDTAKVLSSAKLKNASFVVIGHGVNDAMLDVHVSNSKDPYDAKTFEGALRTSLENIAKALPGAKIILVSPVPYFIEGETCNEELLRGYAECEAKISAEYGAIFVDAGSRSGISAANHTEFLSDGIHYTDEGAKLISALIIQAIEESGK